MMTTKLIIEGTPDEQIKVLEAVRGLSTPNAQLPAEPVAKTPDPVESIPQQAPVMQAPVAPAEPAPAMAVVPSMPVAAPMYSVKDLQAAAGQVVTLGKRDEAIALMQSFGAAAVDKIPADRLPEFAAGLRALGATI